MEALAIFDVDGTLTDSVALDDRVYRVTLAEVFGFELEREFFGDFPNVTDSGVLESLFLERFGRKPSFDEIDGFVRRFVHSLSQELASAARCAQIGGAGRFLESLRRSQRWAVALATGSFSASARLKLAAAGIGWERWIASADDAVSREDIFALAIERSGGTRARTVLVGDAEWDARTARRLGIAFVGVAPMRRGAKLRALGAADVLADFRDRRRAREVLDAAVALAR
ncbi:MAG TPA: HAD family hydrolase [Thermoanaerobaculia bacterium]|nr:HAD family hydrolase [Thermoanaerobaculia bacterium]